MNHLGERVSDLVDGQLDGPSTEQAHTHLAGCDLCREQVEAERLTKARLAALEAPPLPGALLASLLAVGSGEAAAEHPAAAPVPSARPLDGVPSGSRRPAGAPEAGRPSGGRRTGRFGRRPVRARVAAGFAGSVGALGAALVALSVLSPGANAAITPAANLSLARTVATMGGVPLITMLPGLVAETSTHRR